MYPLFWDGFFASHGHRKVKPFVCFFGQQPTRKYCTVIVLVPPLNLWRLSALFSAEKHTHSTDKFNFGRLIGAKAQNF